MRSLIINFFFYVFHKFCPEHIRNGELYINSTFVDLSINCVKDETECEINAENEDYDNDPAPEIFDSEKEQILKAKAGWTIKNADTVRIGDLYLMVIYISSEFLVVLKHS